MIVTVTEDPDTGSTRLGPGCQMMGGDLPVGQPEPEGPRAGHVPTAGSHDDCTQPAAGLDKNLNTAQVIRDLSLRVSLSLRVGLFAAATHVSESSHASGHG